MFAELIALLSYLSVSDTPRSDAFDLDYYVGNWYQISDIPQFYEKSCKDCTQAVYWVASPNNVSVLNMAVNPQTQSICKIQGYAYATNPRTPKDLFVVFPSINSPPMPYSIIDLGPIVNGQYSYSVVSNPARSTLYILARTRTIPASLYQTLIADLKQKGYPVNELVLTNQQNCPTSESFH